MTRACVVNVKPPAHWTFAREEARRSATLGDRGLVLEWFPLTALPRRQLEWVKRVMGGGLPPRRTVGALEIERTETTRGWPVVLAKTELVGGPFCLRLGAFYAFFEHGGHALVQATDRAAWAEENAALRAML